LSENPLLPHSKLRELHALMLRCRALGRKQKSLGAREALLAATSIHLLPGDLLSAVSGDSVAEELAPEAKKKSNTEGSVIGGAAAGGRMLRCAAAARGLQAAGAEGLVLALARAGGAELGWQSSLEWAHASELPLLMAVADATACKPSRGGKRAEPALDFTSMSRLAKRLKLPVLTVDGEDAVAVYRVMQESVLRARMGGGPAVLWAVMTPAADVPKLPRSQQPIVRLEKYLAARKISLRG
jgi:TPP-dependent pyruvate/acetoin dehydrogenase alpha subunit